MNSTPKRHVAVHETCCLSRKTKQLPICKTAFRNEVQFALEIYIPSFLKSGNVSLQHSCPLLTYLST